MRSDRAVPVTARGQEQPCPENVLLRRTELAGRGERSGDCFARLLVGVAALACCRAAHRDVLPDPNSTGIGGGFFEAAALPVLLSH